MELLGEIMTNRYNDTINEILDYKIDRGVIDFIEIQMKERRK